MTIDDYIDSHIDAQPETLVRVERATNLRLVNPRMCSGHWQGRLLKMIVRLTGARNILELGAFSGYSALCMAEGLPEGGVVHTIEVDDELEDFICDNISTAGCEGKVVLHIGDAMQIVPQLMNEMDFDMVFIDADKRAYPDYYELIVDKLRSGGVIVADNTLWDGHVIEADEVRHDSQTMGVKRFNDRVAADPRVEKVILPVRDGLTLIYKK